LSGRLILWCHEAKQIDRAGRKRRPRPAQTNLA